MFKAFLDFFGFGAKSRAYIRVRGQVFEGGYHFFVEKAVRARGLKGWLRTIQLPLESCIEMEVEGTRHHIEKLLKGLQNGPATAKVFAAEVQWKTFKGEFRDFRTKH